MAPRAAAPTFELPDYTNILLRDNINNNSSSQLDIHRSRLHTIYAKPFNHLSVWAYLAFAFIILAVSTVVAYLVYTCYHSSKRSVGFGMGVMGPDMSASAGDRDGTDIGREDSISHWEYCGPRRTSASSSLGRGIGSMRKLGAGDVGEKSGTANSNSRAIGCRNDVEMKGLSSGYTSNKLGSESEENIFSLPSNSVSDSLYNINDTSFEINSHYLSSPPLAHISDKSAAYIPFHLPPPPPSPTPAYKEHLERQYRASRRPGGGSGVGHSAYHQSPVSPSPSCSFSPATASFQPITPRTGSSLVLGDLDNTWSSSTSASPTENLHSATGSGSDGGGQPSGNAQGPVVHFESNNAGYVPTLNPFMTPSTVLFFNEPKLSPVLGTLTSNPTSGSSAYAGSGDSSFSRAVLAASVSARNPLQDIIPNPQKRAKPGVSISGPQNSAARREDKENVNTSRLNANLYPTYPLNEQPPSPMPF